MKIGFLKNLLRFGEKKYVKISPELEKLSPNVFDYFKKITPEIENFAKTNGVVIEVAPRKNPEGKLDFKRIKEIYNMELFDTKVANVKKIQHDSTDVKSLYNSNVKKSIFDIYPSFDENPQPFLDRFIWHVKSLTNDIKK